LLAIAVVRCDDGFAAELQKFRDDPRTAFVHGLNRFYASFNHASVANHVGIGEIQDDQIVIGHAREQLVGHLERAHLRL
jgi:hypothetical protein